MPGRFLCWGMTTTPKALTDLAKQMRGLDICMLSTVSAYGHLAGRPMSNNGEVDYDGTSYFFTWKDSRMVHDIEKNDNVSLTFQGKGLFMVYVQGKAKVTDNRPKLEEHWRDELKQWFKEGLDTPGLVLLEVQAGRINWWNEDGDGEIDL